MSAHKCPDGLDIDVMHDHDILRAAYPADGSESLSHRLKRRYGIGFRVEARCARCHIILATKNLEAFYDAGELDVEEIRR